MNFSGFHIKRYRQIATLLWKYGRSDLAGKMSAEKGFGIEFVPSVETEIRGGESVPAANRASPAQLANDLEAMGPTYVKLGQVLAGRPDLLPAAYLQALARLQDNVKPFSYGEVEEIVRTELGCRISKAFSRFEMEPIAAASLGQVHRAALHDGRAVVVKVQRPNVRKQIAEDFEVLEQIAGFLDNHTAVGRLHRFQVILGEFRQTIQQELDYEREAHNLTALGANLKSFKLIQVPQPVPDYSTRSVLTMEEVRGRKITALGPLARMELDGAALAEELFKAYLKQVLVDGLFHADPHPGNVFVTDDGRIALIDLGMVGHVGAEMQENLLKILLALGEGNGDAAGRVAILMSEKREEFAEIAFCGRIAQVVALQRDQGLAQLNVGRSLLELSRIAQENGLVVPGELILLGKTMLQLDEIGRSLDPEFDASASIRRNVSALMVRCLGKEFTQGNIFSSLLEMKDFVAGLPFRLNRLMDAVTHSDLEVKVKATDAKMVMDGMAKFANRITMGVVLAGLIVGASLLARVESRFRLFGYPGLAIFCFTMAAAGSFWLVTSIFISDYRSRKKHTH